MLKKISLLFAFLFVMGLSVQAQNKASFNSKKHIPVLSEEADILFSVQNYYHALSLYLDLIKLDSTEYYYSLQAGICYLYTDDKEKAIIYLKKVAKASPDANEVDYYLGRAYHLNYQFDTAIYYFKKYLSSKPKVDMGFSAENYIKYCNNAKILTANPDKVEITNLGPFVNTEASEYAPIISGDESEIIFTYRGPNSTGGLEDINFKRDTNGDYYEDIFKVEKIELNWVAPEKIIDLDTKGNDAGIALSIDGQSLFTFKSTPEDRGDIFMSKLEGIHWTKPERLGANINTKYWEGSCSLSPSGKTLYFASERPGGFGGRDIYYSLIQSDGSWGPAHNLGSNINTPLNDDAPFIHPDGTTLFFSSEGWNSMGGYDVFYSTFNQEDSVWNTPVNMGFPINSTDDDRYYVLTPDGNHGYFSSNRKGGYGQQDLYVVSPGYRGVRPILTLTIGVVTVDNMPVKAEIKVTDLKTDKNWGNFQSNSVSGKYIVALAKGTKYKIAVEVQGLNPHIEYLDLDSLRSFIKLEDSVHLYTDEYKRLHNVSVVDTTNVIQETIYKQMKKYFAKEDSDSKKAEKYLGILNKYGTVDSNGINYSVQLGKYRNASDFDSTKLRGLGKIKSRVDNDGSTIFYIDSINTLIDAEKIKYKAIAHDSLIKNADITINNRGHRENFDQFYHTGYDKGKDSLVAIKVEKPMQPNPDTVALAKPIPPVTKKIASNYDSTTRIGNIYYDFDKWDIADTAKNVLNQIVKIMKADACIEMDIYSFTDSRGTLEYNLVLSQKRANSAVRYLVSKGIEINRIKGKGLGKTHQLNDCGNSDVHCSEADYALNRRTEFKIVRRTGCK